MLMFVACASAGATYRSGVGDRYIEHPPYYSGRAPEAVAGEAGPIGHLPVTFQLGATQPRAFDPRTGARTPMDSLLQAMNRYLDSLGVTRRLVESASDPAVVVPATAVPPDVRFGCIPDLVGPNEDCAPRGDSALGRGPQQMLLAVGRPSAEWTAWHRQRLDAAGVTRAVVLTLEVGQYLTRQEGLLGRKVVELGSAHRVPLPWLTSLEAPVTVLQLTAALVDREGRAVRIGAEGIHPRRTRLLVSAAGAQELLGDEDIRAVGTTRRDDLPGQPLAWQVALRTLVEGVTGRR
jgi:hypothetical protein